MNANELGKVLNKNLRSSIEDFTSSMGCLYEDLVFEFISINFVFKNNEEYMVMVRDKLFNEFEVEKVKTLDKYIDGCKADIGEEFEECKQIVLDMGLELLDVISHNEDALFNMFFDKCKENGINLRKGAYKKAKNNIENKIKFTLTDVI